MPATRAGPKQRVNPPAVVEATPVTAESSCAATSVRWRSTAVTNLPPSSWHCANPATSSPPVTPRARALIGPIPVSNASITRADPSAHRPRAPPPTRSKRDPAPRTSPCDEPDEPGGEPTSPCCEDRVTSSPRRCLPLVVGSDLGNHGFPRRQALSSSYTPPTPPAGGTTRGFGSENARSTLSPLIGHEVGPLRPFSGRYRLTGSPRGQRASNAAPQSGCVELPAVPVPGARPTASGHARTACAARSSRRHR